MKTVDHAFLRAYSRDRASSQNKRYPEKTIVAHRDAAASSGAPTIEDIYSDGGWYRVDTPVESVPAAVPTPRRSAPTNWYDPPWGERVVVEALVEDDVSETIREAPAAAPWDVSSFMVMPGVAERVRDEELDQAGSAIAKPRKVPGPSRKAASAGRPAAPRPSHRRPPEDQGIPIAKPVPAGPFVQTPAPQMPAERAPIVERPLSQASRPSSAILQAAVARVNPVAPAVLPIPETSTRLRQMPAVDTVVAPAAAEEYETEYGQEEGYESFDSVAPASLAGQTMVISNGMVEMSHSLESVHLPATPATNVAPEVPEQPKFAPAWEVTRFHWPQVCVQLDETNCLSEVGEKLKAAASNGLNIMASVATQRGEGCTTVALSLARSAAYVGLRVAIVDADLAESNLAATLGVEPSLGWDEMLDQGLPVTEAALASLMDGITIFPRKPENVSQVSLNDARVAEFLKELTGVFDLVVVDLGQLPASLTQFFHRSGRDQASPIHGVAVVRDVRNTTAEQAQVTANRLRSLGIDQVAIVENFGQADDAK